MLTKIANRINYLKRLAWFVILAGSAIAAASPRQAVPQSAVPADRHRHVLVISVDGMRPDSYTHPMPSSRIPNILRLKNEGSFATAVEGVYPTLTYPSHTTLVTGCLPAQHGIYTNLFSREAGVNPGDWFWFAKSIRCKTLWDEARNHGMTTASVAWPVTAGAKIDWDVPEIWNPAEGLVADPLYVAKFMDPVFGLQLLGALGAPKPGLDSDVLRTRIAVYVIKTHRPDLLLVHLVDMDATQHGFGPRTPQAAAALSGIDAHIGEILSAVWQAGLGGNTDVFVVSDHGFLPVKEVIHPNILLVKAGLLTVDAHGNISGGKIDTIANGGSFFIYWPPSLHLRAQVRQALEPLLQQQLAWAVLGPGAMKDLGADPEVQLALDAPSGAMYDGSASGQLVTAASGGDHGYLPFRHGLAASFIAWGPDIKAGVNLHRIRMVRIAPTILKAMGVNDPSFGKTPPIEDIWKNANH
ncbi:MAG: alkaline phosphatase family protein [Acidobacteriota bacterium]|nr:alkaline phosphatase family protein [Acidobacteriota bacterium]